MQSFLSTRTKNLFPLGTLLRRGHSLSSCATKARHKPKWLPQQKKSMNLEFLQWFIGFSEGVGIFAVTNSKGDYVAINDLFFPPTPQEEVANKRKNRLLLQDIEQSKLLYFLTWMKNYPNKKFGFQINHYDPQILYKIRQNLGFGKIKTYKFKSKNLQQIPYFSYVVSEHDTILRLIYIWKNQWLLNNTQKKYFNWIILFLILECQANPFYPANLLNEQGSTISNVYTSVFLFQEFLVKLRNQHDIWALKHKNDPLFNSYPPSSFRAEGRSKSNNLDFKRRKLNHLDLRNNAWFSGWIDAIGCFNVFYHNKHNETWKLNFWLDIQYSFDSHLHYLSLVHQIFSAFSMKREKLCTWLLFKSIYYFRSSLSKLRNQKERSVAILGNGSCLEEQVSIQKKIINSYGYTYIFKEIYSNFSVSVDPVYLGSPFTVRKNSSKQQTLASAQVSGLVDPHQQNREKRKNAIFSKLGKNQSKIYIKQKLVLDININLIPNKRILQNTKKRRKFSFLFLYLDRYPLQSKKNISYSRFKKIWTRLNDTLLRKNRSLIRLKRLIHNI